MHLPNGPLAMPHSPEHESFSVYASFKYYCLKSYLLRILTDDFIQTTPLAPDFFSLAIWKANRSKSNCRQSWRRGRRSTTRRA